VAGKREIKTTLKLEGEQQFKRAMSDATTSLRELDSEQRLAEAQFKATGDAQAYMAEKSRILQQKIAEQQKVVDAGEQALAEMKKQGVDPTTKAYRDMQRKVNDAKVKVTDMQIALNNNENELKQQSSQLDTTAGDAQAYGESMESIDSSIKFENAINAVSRLKEHLKQVLTTIWNVGKGVVELEMEGGKWADELITQADNIGIGVEEMQRWRYASQQVDVEIGTIQQAADKLGQSLDASGDTSEDFYQTLNRIGVAYRNENGTLKTNIDLFWDIIDALHNANMSESELEKTTQSLFGKKFREVQRLVEGGSQAFFDYGNSVSVVSEDAVNSLGKENDAWETLTQELDSAKYTILAGMADTFTSVATSLSSVVKSFNEFLASEAGQKALQGLNDALAGLIAEFTGEQNFEGLVDAAAAAVKKLTDGLAWIKENSSFVTGGMYALVGAFGALTVAEPVLTFLQLLSSTNLTRKLKQLGVANGAVNGARVAAGAGGAGAGASGAGAAAAGGATVIPWWQKWLNKIFAGADAAAIGAGTGLTMTPNIFVAQKEAEEYADDMLGKVDDLKATKAAEEEWLESVNSLFDPDVYLKPEEATKPDGTINLDAFTGVKADDLIASTRSANITPVAESLLGYLQWAQKTSTDLDNLMANLQGEGQTADNMRAVFGDDWADFYGAGTDAETALSAMIAQLQADIAAGADTLGADGAEMGAQTGAGLIEGMNAQIPALQTAAANLARIVSGTIRETLRINSPSRVMAGLGAYTAQGFAEGIGGSVWRVEDAMDKMIGATQRRPVYPRGGYAAGGAQGGAGGMINATIVMDKEVVGMMVAPAVDGVIGATISARR